MKKTILLIISIIMSCACYSQVIEKNYLDSYKKFEKEELVNFNRLVNTGKKMTKEEALYYVYEGDTSRLYCVQKKFNMETEKVEGFTRELFLPNKCLRIDKKDYTIIAITIFECQDIEKILTIKLMLYIVNNNYELTDKMGVYSGNDYDYDLSGLINTSNGNVFLTGVENRNQRYAKIFKVSNENLKFELIKEKHNYNFSTENWKQELEKLGWLDQLIK